MAFFVEQVFALGPIPTFACMSSSESRGLLNRTRDRICSILAALALGALTLGPNTVHSPICCSAVKSRSAEDNAFGALRALQG